MDVIIDWSDEATKTFDKNIKYLAESWTEKEIKNFIKQTTHILSRIEKHPEMYSPSLKTPGVRKVAINKYIILFYQYYSSFNKIVLLSFWHNKLDPRKLKY